MDPFEDRLPQVLDLSAGIAIGEYNIRAWEALVIVHSCRPLVTVQIFLLSHHDFKHFPFYRLILIHNSS